MLEDYQAGKTITGHVYAIPDFVPEALSTTFILSHAPELSSLDAAAQTALIPLEMAVNTATFGSTAPGNRFPQLQLALQGSCLMLYCSCDIPAQKLCQHQAQLLFGLKNRREWRLFFDEKLRHEKIKPVAEAYGLQHEPRLDDFFLLAWTNQSLEITPKQKGLFPLNLQTRQYLQEQLLSAMGTQTPYLPQAKEGNQMLLVLGQHRFYNHLSIELFEAQTTKEGKLKNPLQPLAPLDLLLKEKQEEVVKFWGAVSRFQGSYSNEKSAADIEALKVLLKNPLALPFYLHDAAVSVNMNAASLVQVAIKALSPQLHLYVQQKEAFYELSGQLLINEKAHDLKSLRLRHQYFIQLGDTLHLIDQLAFLKVLDFFKQYNQTLLIHHSKFEEFRREVLEQLEHKVRIHYAYVKPAKPEQLAELGFDESVGKIIYLQDSEDWVRISPVMRYGQIECPVLSKKQLYSIDDRGNPFLIERDEATELAFIAALLLQHPDFEEQLQLDHFYLHKTRFLAEDWFMKAFEAWREQGITILGFNTLQGNKLNPYRGKVSIGVSSGVDWFDTHLELRYGNQKVSLRHLHKSLRNKSRFVQLDDGTQGLLPAEWIEKFSRFFEAAEIRGELLRTPKMGFASIQELYEEEVLSAEVKKELAALQARLREFESIQEVATPHGLKAHLRDYQKQGLNWLHFLDEWGFGGCLADDMGLGKTIQVLAFLLRQQEKGEHNANLVVVPTTLLFNWQAEVAKIAPSLKILTFHGPGRTRDIKLFDAHQIVLTTYGTLLSDIRLLKQYRFNYIILDESQNIKNPESQRYKAARLLQARNRLLLTGTPFENNTFDLYGQLSFACPGLLGSRQHFKEQWATPIDKFKDSKRARWLQQKLSPFILRRTKEQVAPELPEKTEMTLFCEMGTEQRRLYNAYAKEFREFLLNKSPEDIDKHSMHVLQGLTKLRQLCNSPALLPDQQHWGSTSAKIEVLLEQIESKAPQHKILVFSQFVGMLNLIRQELDARNIPYEYLTGQSRNRAEKVEAFQQKDGVRVFLISLKAGGTGLNLTEADYVYLVDPWWNPAVENQAIDRSHRIGQNKRVVAVRLRCPDTIEEKMMRLQEAKSLLAGDLIKTDAAVLKSLSKQDLLALLGESSV